MVRTREPRRRKLARELLKPINTAAIVILGVFTVVWGFWVGNPWWSVFDRAPLYDAMRIVPEFVWGAIAIITGLAMIHGVLRHSYRALLWGAKAGFYHWICISTLFFIGDWQNTGGPTALMIGIYCAFIWLNIRINRDTLS